MQYHRQQTGEPSMRNGFHLATIAGIEVQVDWSLPIYLLPDHLQPGDRTISGLTSRLATAALRGRWGRSPRWRFSPRSGPRTSPSCPRVAVPNASYVKRISLFDLRWHGSMRRGDVGHHRRHRTARPTGHHRDVQFSSPMARADREHPVRPCMAGHAVSRYLAPVCSPACDWRLSAGSSATRR